jgi:oligopeptide transport system ATP-binding protein
MPKLLEVRNLETRFYTMDGVVNAVNGVSYSLNEGEVLGIVGESGCGKSVSVMSMLRLIPCPPGKITRGEVIFQGVDLLKLSSQEIRQVRGHKIGVIFQDPLTSLNPVLPISLQMCEGMEVHLGITRAEARKKSIEFLDLVGIPNSERRIDDYPHQFSGGMRQRVMIAISLSCHPSILIADEPTTALDVTTQVQIIDLVQRLRRDMGLAVIWITHDLGIIAGLADRVNVMYAGYIIESGQVDEIYEHPLHPYTIGLLGSLPRMDEKEHTRLRSIAGVPPDLMSLPSLCPFAPRCEFVKEQCCQSNPQLSQIKPEHWAACWNVTPARIF